MGDPSHGRRACTCGLVIVSTKNGRGSHEVLLRGDKRFVYSVDENEVIPAIEKDDEVYIVFWEDRGNLKGRVTIWRKNQFYEEFQFLAQRGEAPPIQTNSDLMQAAGQLVLVADAQTPENPLKILRTVPGNTVTALARVCTCPEVGMTEIGAGG